MSNNKQSSLVWFAIALYTKLLEGNGNKFNDLLEQAKAQHKKEMIDFALHCMMPNMEPDKATIDTISDIYDEIFNK